jgi:glutamate dehydrogenase
MEVDVLWNGGIGTYVKADHESHADAGDRANDAVRIDASALRARVVGEGGNLGLTQAARVQAALRGVRLDTDAIDNSAGVDLSDHEVNFKVALAPLVRSGELGAEERRRLLFGCAEAACEAVLSHNRGQALSISLDQIRSRREPDVFLRAAEQLCQHAQLDPAELDLPDAAAVTDRRSQDVGFTRPELAVLLGLAKLHAQAELIRSELPLEDYLEPLYRDYFASPLRERFPEALEGHRLRREIAALCLVNRLVDAGGATALVGLVTELGTDVAEAAAALVMAEDVLDVPELRARLVSAGGPDRAAAYHALIEVDEGVREVARYLVRSGAGELDAERIERWRTGGETLRAGLREYLSPGELQRLEARRERLERSGLAPDLALEVASLPLADRGLNILRICERTALPPIDVARVYASLGEAAGINWVYGRLAQAEVTSLWDRLLLVDLRWELLDLQREITERVLGAEPRDLEEAVEGFAGSHAPVLARVRELERSAAAEVGPSALSVITARLRGLRAGASAEHDGN